VGYTVPEEYFRLIKTLRERVPNSDKARFSAHCHDDLGMAVANSLAAVRGGARQVECAVNGIGERAGNCALEDVVMALKTRSDTYGVSTRVDTTRIMAASRTLAQITNTPPPRNKAIVGANAFAHEAGIHQDGMLKHRSTYEIITPELVGHEGMTLVLGKHSGRRAVRRRLEELGHELGDDAFAFVFQRFKELADRKKAVGERDLLLLLTDEDGPQRRLAAERVLS
jgi:2-isopropylmalate synthase